MNVTRVGVDIAKSVFHVHGVDRRDQPQWCTNLKRAGWLDALCERVTPGAEVGIVVDPEPLGALRWAVIPRTSGGLIAVMSRPELFLQAASRQTEKKEELVVPAGPSTGSVSAEIVADCY